MKRKVKILVVTHGQLAQYFVETVKFIAGEISDIEYINFTFDKTGEWLESEIEKFINLNKDSNIIIFLDMLGGSCYNASCKFIRKNKNVKIFAGLNLPVLLESAMNKDYIPFSELIKRLKVLAKESIVFVNEKLKGCRIR